LTQRKALVAPSEQAWKSCVVRLNEIDKARRVESIVGRFAPALCGVFFIAIVLGGLVARHRSDQVAPKVNIARLLPGKSTASSQSDQEKLEWYKHLLNQSKMSTPDPLTLRQVSICLYQGAPVTQLRASDGNGELIILLIPKPLEISDMTPMQDHPEYRLGRYRDMNCISRPEGDNTTVILARRSYEDLAGVMAQLPVNMDNVMSHIAIR